MEHQKYLFIYHVFRKTEKICIRLYLQKMKQIGTQLFCKCNLVKITKHLIVMAQEMRVTNQSTGKYFIRGQWYQAFLINFQINSIEMKLGAK